MERAINADEMDGFTPFPPIQEWRIFACMPSYGDKVDPESHQRFLTASSRPNGPTWNRCDKATLSRSLLANCFNILWTRAINMREAGRGTKYFAMLHSDIVPDDGWLDILWEDLERSGADLMSAVVPIKDFRGLTSTAISDPEDSWGVLRRLSMHEITNKNLPEIFGAAELGYPNNYLLANTGCWICRLDRPWVTQLDEGLDEQTRTTINELLDWIEKNVGADPWLTSRILSCVLKLNELGNKNKGYLKAHFNIRDGIKRVKKGMLEPCVASEDWEFSRILGEMGAKVMCTKRVKLRHMGGMPYGNFVNWGDQKCDMTYGEKFGFLPIGETRKSIGPTTQGYTHTEAFPDVEGWLTDSEGQALANIAKGKKVLEIGSYKGRSTIWMGRTAEVVYAVDTFQSSATASVEGVDTEKEFRDNLKRYSIDNVAVIRGKLDEVVDTLHDDFFDLVFIDGAHDYASTLHDLNATLPKLNRDGIIAFHDYDKELGVTRLVNEIITEKLVEKLGVIDSLAVVKPIQDQDTEESPNGDINGDEQRDVHREVDQRGRASGASELGVTARSDAE